MSFLIKIVLKKYSNKKELQLFVTLYISECQKVFCTILANKKLKQKNTHAHRKKKLQQQKIQKYTTLKRKRCDRN